MNCTITIDRNIKQRKEVKKLVEEAKLKFMNLSKKHYLLRGSSFKPYIIEVSKRSDFLRISRKLNVGKLAILYTNDTQLFSMLSDVVVVYPLP